MKKILMGSFVLLIFSASVLIFQMSCKKESVAQTDNGSSQLHRVIFKKVVSNGMSHSIEIWTANYDGTNATKANILLPSGTIFTDDMSPMLSPDGKKIFFTAGSDWAGSLYTCNADGSGVIKIVDKGGNDNNIVLGGAY